MQSTRYLITELSELSAIMARKNRPPRSDVRVSGIILVFDLMHSLWSPLALRAAPPRRRGDHSEAGRRRGAGGYAGQVRCGAC